MLPISAEVRERAGVAAGDEVDVELELDTEPREVAVPPELAELLEREPDAKRTFEALSYSGKQRLVGPIADARTAETRQRRLDKAISQLRTGRA
jgi:uncharacterized protein YdeI (YjbR/CyaY-like superfamily)